MPEPDALLHTIVAFIRAGSFPRVAAEAAGVSGEVFDAWMATYRHFRDAVLKAQAEARLAAEVELREAKPLDWLRCGPGKPAGLGDGWTTPAKASTGPPKAIDLLALPQTQEVIARVLAVLEPHPDLRQAVATALSDMTTDE